MNPVSRLLDDPENLVARGEFRVNPMYAAAPEGGDVRLTLRFPSDDYAQEYGACRQYLPDQVVADRSAIETLPARTIPAALTDLAKRHVIIDLPTNYY